MEFDSFDAPLTALVARTGNFPGFNRTQNRCFVQSGGRRGRWLDLSEFELGVLSVQCLNRRIPEKQILIKEVAVWEHDRNANHTKTDWHLTTANARIKVEIIAAIRRSLSLIQLWSAHVARCRG